MTIRTMVAVAGVLCMAGASLAQVRDSERGAQPPAKAPSQPQPSQEEMQAAWMATMEPAEEHKRLDPMIGEWETTARFWMEPGTEPMEGKGKSTMEWVLGGRHIKQTFTGNFMGQPFEGLGYTGYDRVKKKYIGTWMDTMSTSAMHSEGEYDAPSGMIVMHSAFVDPFGREIKGRETLKLDGPDMIIFTMYHTEPGKPEAKVGEITYKRAGTSDADAAIEPARPANPGEGGGR